MIFQASTTYNPNISKLDNDLITVKDWAAPLIIAGSIILAGIFIERGTIMYLKRISKKTKWKVESVLISSLKGMIILIAVLFGVYFGLTQAPISGQIMAIVGKFHKVFVVFIITFVIARILTGMLKAHSSREERSRSSLSLFNSIINIIIYCIGLLVMLESLGISITPVLTALGVGGLAVALALQDTLANLFAGIQITLARTIKPGDYIKLSTGEEGMVVDITWRSTTLRIQNDNNIIIPNSKLSTTNVTNYAPANTNLNISIIIRVGYENDLNKVQKISLEVAEEVTKQYGVKSHPVFLFKEPGDSSITCSISMDVIEFSKQDNMRHDLIMKLYNRFKKESIDIPYPVRKINLEKEHLMGMAAH